MPTVHGERRGVCRCNPPDRSGLNDAARVESDEVRVLCFFWAPAMNCAQGSSIHGGAVQLAVRNGRHRPRPALSHLYRVGAVRARKYCRAARRRPKCRPRNLDVEHSGGIAGTWARAVVFACAWLIG